VSDFDLQKDRLNRMLDYHNNKLSQLDAIHNQELHSSVLYLKSAINLQIIKPITRALAMIEFINEIGVENIPTEMKTDWLDDIELISSLNSLEVR
tara:strand:- start:233 stop:517 length:285 start_codon:yes stop_codon:yes gene_type:complete